LTSPDLDHPLINILEYCPVLDPNLFLSFEALLSDIIPGELAYSLALVLHDVLMAQDPDLFGPPSAMSSYSLAVARAAVLQILHSLASLSFGPSIASLQKPNVP
jgi:hypothetical protein